MKSKNTIYLRYIIVALLIIALDQATKYIAFNKLYQQPAVDVLPFLQWVMVFNRGAAFGFLSSGGGWQHWLFGGLAIGVSVFILVWLYRICQTQVTLAVGLTLVLGGAIGNLIDRLMHQYVIDFIHIYYQNWSFPAFNIADISICCGAALLILDNFREPLQKPGRARLK